MILSYGVTGHRNFASDDARLGAIVAAEMLEARQALAPAAGGVVVSALAEGADRLVARIGLERFGWDLVVALPMPRDAYAMDFAGDASRAEFDALLARAGSVVEAPLLEPGADWRAYTEARNHQYAWAGAYLVAACDVLVALWDGQPARGTGGTAHVVDWFLAGHWPDRYAISTAQVRSGPPATRRRLVHIVPATGEVRRHDIAA